MHGLEKQLRELEAYIPRHSEVRTAASTGSVGWHIEHSLITIRRIINAVKVSDASDYKGSFNLKRFIVLTFNTIPRGSVKAPSVVQPGADIDEATLKESYRKTLLVLSEFDGLGPNQHFPHPVFGQLNKKPTARFLYVHTAHHLKIIRDILKHATAN